MGTTKDQELYILRVIQARESSGITQEEISRRIGVERPTYSNYERHRPMPQKYIAKFCQITNTNERWLLTGNGDMRNSHTDTWEQKRFDFIHSLEESDRQRYDDAMRLIFPDKFNK